MNEEITSTEVFKLWKEVMQALWVKSIDFYCNLLPQQDANKIYLGASLNLFAKMVNNSYVIIYLYEGDNELCTIRYEGSVELICDVIFLIIKSKI